MREARIDESVCAIDYRWPMGGTGDYGARHSGCKPGDVS
jgi:hypothetical protein